MLQYKMDNTITFGLFVYPKHGKEGTVETKILTTSEMHINMPCPFWIHSNINSAFIYLTYINFNLVSFAYAIVAITLFRYAGL